MWYVRLYSLCSFSDFFCVLFSLANSIFCILLVCFCVVFVVLLQAALEKAIRVLALEKWFIDERNQWLACVFGVSAIPMPFTLPGTLPALFAARS